MRVIRKKDLVFLPDGSFGQTLEAFVTDRSRVYKIRKIDSNEILYFDETKVKLKKQHVRNFLTDIFK